MIRLSRRSRFGSAALATAILGLGSAAGLATAPHSLAASFGEFSCRASVVRVTGKALPIGTIEPFVANPQDDPCRTSSAGLIAPTALPTGAGDHIAVANAQTVDNESLNGPSTATADARVVDLQVGGTLARAR